MEQKILSLKDDKINSEVELFEYPEELIGGRNYAYIKYDDEYDYNYIFVSNDFPRNEKQQMSLSLWGNFEEFANVNPFDDEILFGGNYDSRFYGYTYIRKSVNHIVYEGGYIDLSLEDDEDLTLAPYGEADESLITKVKIEIGTKATDWTPAPEDLNLSYPDFITEFKPSISDRYILTEELIEGQPTSFSNKITTNEFIEQ